MAWEENSRICLHMQLIAILSRIGVIILLNPYIAKTKYKIWLFMLYPRRLR